MKTDALSFSFAGDKYLGRSYEDVDCQKFVEKCMADCGLREDLPGSNSWYRHVMRNGWVGTPEDCVRKFGLIPKGALLFILSEVGPNTPAKFRNDGIGDANHIGIVIQRHDGAIHSSSRKGGVAYSKFEGKTIPGGWNRIGLYDKFTYGKSVDWMLEHIGIGEEEMPVLQAIVKSQNGGSINLREGEGKRTRLIDRIPSGEIAQILDSGETWSKIKWQGKTGYVMTQFLFADDDIPAEDPDDFEPADIEPDEPQDVILKLTAAEAAAIYPVLNSIARQIVSQIGRG